MDLSVLAIIISVIIGLITIATVVWKGGGLANELRTLTKRHDLCPINQIQIEMAGVKKQQEIFWTVLQPHLAAIIHSPEHQRRDELVDKLISNNIDFDELVELEPLLYKEANNGVVEKRLPAALLSARVQILLTRGP
jgi:hypothetical protein